MTICDAVLPAVRSAAACFPWAGRTNNLEADWSKHQQQLPDCI